MSIAGLLIRRERKGAQKKVIRRAGTAKERALLRAQAGETFVDK